MAIMAMFPLGSVLFPSMVLPLHIFEPRYRQLTRDCLDGDGEFGVVLIERGSEVGGGDVRTLVGTVARILDSQELADGRWAVAAVGERRIRVTRWLDDDPYPRAEVEQWPEPPPGPALAPLVDTTTAAMRRVLAMATELGEPAAPATIELAEDPVLATYQAAAIGPFGPADQQRLLEAPSAAGRLELLDRLLEEEAEVLARRLALGPPQDAGGTDPAG